MCMCLLLRSLGSTSLDTFRCWGVEKFVAVLGSVPNYWLDFVSTAADKDAVSGSDTKSKEFLVWGDKPLLSLLVLLSIFTAWSCEILISRCLEMKCAMRIQSGGKNPSQNDSDIKILQKKAKMLCFRVDDGCLHVFNWWHRFTSQPIPRFL